MSFGHERPDVYRAAIEYVGWAYRGQRIDSDTDSDPEGNLLAGEMPNRTLHVPCTTGPNGQAGSVPVRRRLASFGVRLLAVHE